MIVWRGMGLLVVAMLVGPLFATFVAPKGWENGVVALAYLVSAPLTWFAGRRFNQGLHYPGSPSHQGLGRILDDGFRDRELRSPTPWSSFMMVKFEYWCLPLGLIAIAFGVLQALSLTG
jgi:hypothetical protein